MRLKGMIYLLMRIAVFDWSMKAGVTHFYQRRLNLKPSLHRWTNDPIDKFNPRGSNRNQARCLLTGIIKYVKVGIASQLQRTQWFQVSIQVDQHEIRLDRFNLVQGTPLAVGYPHQLDTGHLIQLRAQGIFATAGIDIDNEQTDLGCIH